MLIPTKSSRYTTQQEGRNFEETVGVYAENKRENGKRVNQNANHCDRE